MKKARTAHPRRIPYDPKARVGMRSASLVSFRMTAFGGVRRASKDEDMITNDLDWMALVVWMGAKYRAPVSYISVMIDDKATPSQRPTAERTQSVNV